MKRLFVLQSLVPRWGSANESFSSCTKTQLLFLFGSNQFKLSFAKSVFLAHHRYLPGQSRSFPDVQYSTFSSNGAVSIIRIMFYKNWIFLCIYAWTKRQRGRSAFLLKKPSRDPCQCCSSTPQLLSKLLDSRWPEGKHRTSCLTFHTRWVLWSSKKLTICLHYNFKSISLRTRRWFIKYLSWNNICGKIIL